MRNWFTWPAILPPTVGWPSLMLCAFGFLVILSQVRHREMRAAALIAVIFPVWYFWLIVTQGSLQYGRYLLPITPVIALCFAIGAATVWRLLGATSAIWRRAAFAALPVLLTPPLLTSVYFDIGQARIGTAEQAGQWILEHVRPDERLAVEMAAVRLPPRMQVEDVRWLIDRTMDDYRSAGVSYLVATSAAHDRYGLRTPEQRDANVAAHAVLMRSGQIVAVFPASADHPGDTVTVVRVPR